MSVRATDPLVKAVTLPDTDACEGVPTEVAEVDPVAWLAVLLGERPGVGEELPLTEEHNVARAVTVGKEEKESCHRGDAVS